MRSRFVALAGLVLMLAACGSTQARPEATALPITLLPSADPFTSAIVATKALGTARLVVDVTHPGGSAASHGEGVTVLGSGQGDVTWTDATTTYRELVNNRGVYVQEPPLTGGWVQWPAGHISRTSGFADPLRGLGVLRDVTNTGPDTLGTVETTRYTGWLPLTSVEAARLGLDGGLAPDSREQVTVWIDGFGHAVKVDRQAESTADSVTSRTDFSEFSVLLNLSSPSHGVTATRS